MKREFSPVEVNNLLSSFESLYSSIKKIISFEDKRKDEVLTAGSKLRVEEIYNILSSSPIDELSKDIKGLRVKSLRDAGYLTLGDIYLASRYHIESVYGISEAMSYNIKNVVDMYAKKLRPSAKIKLSYDNQTKKTTALVKSTYIYMHYQDIRDEAIDFIDTFPYEFDKLEESLWCANSGLVWLFTPKYKKEIANNAYARLKEIESSNFAKKARALIKEHNALMKVKSKDCWEDFKVKNIQYYTTIEEIMPSLLGTDDTLYGLPEELAKEIEQECYFPEGLLCTLRKYQEWGVKYILHQENVLLGDEMGLGKTIQAIATMVSLRNTGATHFLVVCPASVVINWCREIAKHSRLKPIKIHGKDKKGAFKSWLKYGGVGVTTYETTGLFIFPENFKFSLMVVDEAHYIKNPEARRTINTRAVTQYADRLLFMTGTALENRVDEMISLIYDLNPDIARQVEPLSFMSSAKQFREKIAPVYYRRKREDVLTELPEKTEIEEWCELSPFEEIEYESAILGGQYAYARRLSWHIDDLNKSTKCQRLKEIIEEAEAEGRKVIVFSFFLDTIFKIHSYFYDKCVDPIYGGVNPNKRQGIIDEFEASKTKNVLVAQIQSGGTGLNIQGASVVVICEPQFKPSIENQAISRAYRMGQARNVLVYRLLAENTIDEKLLNVLKEKQKIFDAFADKSVAAQNTMKLEVDDKAWGNIIKSEIDRINKKRGIDSHSVRPDTTYHEEYEQDKDSSINESSSDVEVLTNKPTNKGNWQYYQTLMKLNYEDLVNVLLEKHGRAEFNYFPNESCLSANPKVKRSSEGLFCHHIDEDKAIMLSNSNYAVKYPYDYQKADRLVYCNFLEHLLLHIKIVEKHQYTNDNMIAGIGGAVRFICRQINDYYGGKVITQQYLITANNLIKDDYQSYIDMLRLLWSDINNDERLKGLISKEELALNFDDELVSSILKDIG